MNRRCQNSGVVVTAISTEYGHDPAIVENDYFDVPEEIIEFDYFQNNQLVV